MKIGIVGLGASALFGLWKLQNSNHEIHVFDVGQKFIKRKPCPIDTGKLTKCPVIPCWPACIPSTSGGIFNDYKVITSASPVIGGRLFDLIGKEALQEKLNIVKSIILSHAPVSIPEVTPNQEDLDWILNKAKKAGLTYHYQSLLHCGTDNAVEINNNILNSLNTTNIKFSWRTKVTSITRSSVGFLISSETYRPRKWENQNLSSDYFDAVIISIGRGGTKWLTEQEFYKDLEILPGQVDIGVRVETLNEYTKEVDKRFYEPKLYLNSTKHHDVVRNFCSNPGGFVIPENHEEYTLVNGYSKTNKKSENNNFAVLVSKTFTKPFKNPQIYSQHIAKITNMLSGGGPLVQRLGDLKAGRRSKTLLGNSVIPSLESECGDISLAYPHRILEGILEYLDKLNIICPGVASDDTLLYSPEIKTFPDQIQLNKNMLTNVPGLFIIGDASSWTRSVGHSAVSGLLCAEEFLN